MLDGLRTMWENPELIRQFRLGRVYPKKDTSIECAMQDELLRRGIRFVKHLPILNRCQADIAFPERKIAVFCDGDYWHNRPDIRSKDITQEMILGANG
jgi:G:T-mismatch repair DNA endonuclease (very short patch repair protein)